MNKKYLLLSVLLCGCQLQQTLVAPKTDDALTLSIEKSAQQVSAEIKRINNIGASEAKSANGLKNDVSKEALLTIKYIGSLEGFSKALNKIGVSSRVIGSTPMQDLMVSVDASAKPLALIVEDVAAQLPKEMVIKVRDGSAGEVIFQYPQR